MKQQCIKCVKEASFIRMLIGVSDKNNKTEGYHNAKEMCRDYFDVKKIETINDILVMQYR